MSTVFPSEQGIERNWHVIDADDVVLGKLATHTAKLLMGKHKPTYTPFLDTGDHVAVINAGKVKADGQKRRSRRFIGISPDIPVVWSNRRSRRFAPRVRPHD